MTPTHSPTKVAAAKRIEDSLWGPASFKLRYFTRRRILTALLLVSLLATGLQLTLGFISSVHFPSHSLFMETLSSSPPVPAKLNDLFSNTITTSKSLGVANPGKPPRPLLVILTGNLRGGERTWQTLYDRVLQPQQADLALMIGAIPAHYENATLLQRAQYIWHVPEFDDWADAMEMIPNKPADWRRRLFGLVNGTASRRNILLGGANGIPGSGALVFMYRWFVSEQIRRLQLTHRYRRFMVTRADHYYQCPHPSMTALSEENLWVPNGQDYFGICDRHFVASNETVLTALDVLPPVIRNPEAYREILQAAVFNTERFLWYRWNQSGLSERVQRFPRPMFLAATMADASRWSPPKNVTVEPGVHVKYRTEYRESIQGCQALKLAKEPRRRLPASSSRKSSSAMAAMQ